jgi:ferredoxin-thioredoxin reductase catalytic subunit
MNNERIQTFLHTLKTEGEQSGYRLNPDEAFLQDLANGLLTNTDRYGYQACPCRLADGTLEKDLDIICPCDYRDEDLNDFGTCYCALYVDEAVASGKKDVQPIPDRRKEALALKAKTVKRAPRSLEAMPIWRCNVCGYLCARKNPPERCPICKAQKERFETFLI